MFPLPNNGQRSSVTIQRRPCNDPTGCMCGNNKGEVCFDLNNSLSFKFLWMDQLWILMFDVFEYTCTCSRLQLPHARRLSMIFAISCLQLLLSCSLSAWPSTLYSCRCSSPLLCFGINTFVFSCSPSVFIVCLIIHCFCLVVYSMCLVCLVVHFLMCLPI